MARPRTTSDEAILRASARAISLHGPQGFTLAAAAREAGLAAATLVQRFGSKRGLLLAVAAHSARTAGAPFEQARCEHASPLAALHAALASLASGVSTPRELAGSLGFLQLDLTDPDFREHAAEHTRRMRQEIAELLADGVAAGELAPGADVTALARAVQITYNGTLIVWALSGDDTLTAALRHDLAETLRPHLAAGRTGSRS
ncbi:TetR family transcriptional regulator C-terminal domain-containing protein [Nonomuraea sp. SBT364]|uniref:TetR family transcriptional regulator C-terminal domain-containing protein n=1 Tax=Nonomuraea sp. SBT364 TaxID=1580530 RepID=UPI0007C85042|nr:TetR family transcriptional regulator C-terminal domain-containing protein [Nonomuraea sp. SBT364]